MEVSSEVKTCTKGIWICNKPIIGTTENGETINIIIMDTEGIGALDEDSTHDSKIFALSVLLSSTFIFNSMGSIDENSI